MSLFLSSYLKKMARLLYKNKLYSVEKLVFYVLFYHTLTTSIFHDPFYTEVSLQRKDKFSVLVLCTILYTFLKRMGTVIANTFPILPSRFIFFGLVIFRLRARCIISLNLLDTSFIHLCSHQWPVTSFHKT